MYANKRGFSQFICIMNLWFFTRPACKILLMLFLWGVVMMLWGGLPESAYVNVVDSDHNLALVIQTFAICS